MNFEQTVQWVNVPILHIGQTPVTLGGIGSAVFIFICSLFVSMVIQQIIASQLAKKLSLTSGMTYAFRRITHYFIVFSALYWRHNVSV